MKKIISIVLAIMMLAGMIPFGTLTVSAAGNTEIIVESVSATVDSTVEVTVSITGNTGIASMGIILSFDSALTLIEAQNGEAFSDLTMTPPSQLKQDGAVTESCRFAWLGSDNATSDGVILKLKFRVSADAQENTDYVVSVVCESAFDEGREPVHVSATAGAVKVINYIPGDVDGSGVINMLDVLTLCQYYVDGCQYNPNGYAIDINDLSGDVDGNGIINMLDVLMICQYYVDGCTTNPNGYNVTLVPGKVICAHDLQYTSAKASTCTEDGNIAYWMCSLCGEYFSDENATVEISLADTIIPAKGHTEVIDEAVAPTYDTTGLTEGLHCSVCNEVLLEQQIVPKLNPEYYSITYSNLQGVATPELKQYASHIGVSKDNMPKPERIGYKFEGWFTAKDGGTQVTHIPEGSTKDYVLYAHWSIIEYQITYYCGNGVNSLNNILTYDINTSFTFVDATLKGCLFYRWVDQNGNTITRIEKGSTGDLVLTAEYKEMRYTTVPISEIDCPKYKNEVAFAQFDSENNLYTYIYYLGYVANVPLTQSTGVTYNGVGEVTKGYQVTTATSNSIEKGFTNSQSYTISTEVASQITAKEEMEIPASKLSIEASISASLGTSETISYEERMNQAITKSEELSESFSFTIPAGSPNGYYRVTYMGTLDMFVAVVYDPVSDKIDIVYYSILRDETNFAIDYSQSSEFNGHSVEQFDFVIPIKVQDHIQYLSDGSNGLISHESENRTECSIVGYIGKDTNVVIPTYLNGKKVTSIDANLFAGNTSITSVTLGEGITSIPNSAFEGCTSLTSVIFNGELTQIGANAFKGCSSLEFEIPDTVTSIGDAAFDGCVAMDNVLISNTVTKLGSAVFNNCGKLSLTVVSDDLTVSQAAISSGATSVFIDWICNESDVNANCTLTVPAIQTFKFDGNLQTFNNLYIVSDAVDTTIEYVTITNNTGENALTFSSTNVNLRAMSVTSNKTALALNADSVDLSIGGTVTLTANNGCNGLSANNLNVFSAVSEAATLIVHGGDGNKGSKGDTPGRSGNGDGGTGGAGQAGGIGISAANIRITDYLTIEIRGGCGGTGGTGGNSVNKYWGSENSGGTGGTGGAGGRAIVSLTLTIDSTAKVSVYGGNGGTGGKGGYRDTRYGNGSLGSGGSGGTGAVAISEDTVIDGQLYYSENGNNGSAGSTGGNWHSQDDYYNSAYWD